jgi:hypothetical protein
MPSQGQSRASRQVNHVSSIKAVDFAHAKMLAQESRDPSDPRRPIRQEQGYQLALENAPASVELLDMGGELEAIYEKQSPDHDPEHRDWPRRSRGEKEPIYLVRCGLKQKSTLD